MRYILLLLLLFGGLSVEGQKFFYVDTLTFANIPHIPKQPGIGLYDLSNCSYIHHWSPLSYRYADIVQHPNGNVYGVGRHIFDDTQQMCRFDYMNNFPNSLGAIYLLSVYTIDTIQALACDPDGVIYAAGRGLSTFDVATNMFTWHGDLPLGMRAMGDLAYYNGQLLLTTVSNTIVTVNTSNPANSTVLMQMPPGTPPIHGLAAFPVTCDSTVLYAIGTDDNVQKIYRVDFENETLVEICDTGLYIFGAAAIGECSIPACQVFVDLDGDDSSFATGNDFYADTLCRTPIPVCGADADVNCDLPTLDSIVLDLAGILDPGAEYLDFPGSINISAVGSGTTHLVLINSGNTSFADFESALSAVLYQNTAADPQPGLRQVAVVAWSGVFFSETAVSNILLENTLQQPLAQVTDAACHGLQNGSISVQGAGGHAPYQFLWENGSTGNAINGLAPGTYFITITDDGGCMRVDSFLVTEPDTLMVSITFTGLPAICDNSGQLTATPAGGTPPYAYTWSNGSAAPVNSGAGPGNYFLTVTDSNGCTATAGYLIPTGDTVLIMEAAAICQGETFAWGGSLLTADTLACLVFTQPGGCDSTSCLQLTVHPLPALSLTADGNLCGGGPVALSATGQHTAWLWQDGSTGPGLSTDQPGTYSVTVTNAQGCTASASLTLTAGVEYEVTATGPACTGDTDGRIAFQNTSGGTPPLQFSIDGGQTFSSSTVFENLPPGTYSLVVEDAAGCRTESEALLVEPTVILLDAGEDLSIRLGESVTLSAQTNLVNPLVLWQPPDYLDCPDCLSTVASPVKTTVYEVEITDPNGCKARDAVRVAVDGRRRVYVPTAFSPNGDGINDRLTVFGDASVAQVLSLQIFDRWGGLVYEGRNLQPNDTTTGWDGTVNGEAVQPGTYVYVLRLQLADGTEEWMKGEVVVVRN